MTAQLYCDGGSPAFFFGGNTTAASGQFMVANGAPGDGARGSNDNLAKFAATSIQTLSRFCYKTESGDGTTQFYFWKNGAVAADELIGGASGTVEINPSFSVEPGDLVSLEHQAGTEPDRACYSISAVAGENGFRLQFGGDCGNNEFFFEVHALGSEAIVNAYSSTSEKVAALPDCILVGGSAFHQSGDDRGPLEVRVWKNGAALSSGTSTSHSGGESSVFDFPFRPPFAEGDEVSVQSEGSRNTPYDDTQILLHFHPR
jgi:hypothetical protein